VKRTPISSSVIVSAGYDGQACVLEIEFTSGKIYQYFDVPRTRFDGLLTAESAGTYFNANIRDDFEYDALPAP